MYFCVVSFLQEVQIYKKTYVFHIQPEKLMKKINKNDGVYICTIVLCILQ